MENKKDLFKTVALLILGIITVPILFMAITQGAQAEEEYRPLTPQAQVSYDSAFKALCEAEKTLAASKIMDVANNVKMDVDMNALIAKRDKECVF